MFYTVGMHVACTMHNIAKEEKVNLPLPTVAGQQTSALEWK